MLLYLWLTKSLMWARLKSPNQFYSELQLALLISFLFFWSTFSVFLRTCNARKFLAKVLEVRLLLPVMKHEKRRKHHFNKSETSRKTKSKMMFHLTCWTSSAFETFKCYFFTRIFFEVFLYLFSKFS